MLTIDINPDGMAAEYLRCMNACFGNWGDERVYHWCFERAMAGLKADQMIVRLEGNVIAGSAVSYRSIRFPDGRTVLAGIMTGSWTLPEARGQGCFTRMIEESVKLATGHGCAALLAFVTEDNPSRRQLEKAGAILAPSFYLFSDAGTPTPATADSIGPAPMDAQGLAALYAGRSGRTQFVYGSAAEFSSQFMERPTETQLFRTSTGAVGVVERAADTDRLQVLLPPTEESIAAFLRHSLAQGRKLFLFSTQEAVRDTCLTLGMRVKNGYLTMQPIDGNVWPAGFVPVWDIESGDRI